MEDQKPLAAWIAEKGFDRYQPGLRRRFRAYRLDYWYRYAEFEGEPALNIEFESVVHRGRVVARASGACNLRIWDRTTGKSVFTEECQLASERDFFETYPQVPVFMRDAIGWGPAAGRNQDQTNTSGSSAE